MTMTMEQRRRQLARMEREDQLADAKRFLQIADSATVAARPALRAMILQSVRRNLATGGAAQQEWSSRETRSFPATLTVV